MNLNELTAPAHIDPWARIKSLVLDSLSSEHSRRSYAHSLDDFRAWCDTQPSVSFSKAAIQSYRASLESRGLSPSSINLRMSALRKLAIEAADNGLINPDTAGAIARVKGVARRGVRTGNWLTLTQAEQLLTMPDRSTNKGKRDRVILCLLIACGLRREELSFLELSRVQQRDARWALVDIKGKGNRIRTVPMPGWAKVAIDEWIAAAGIVEGRILRAVNRGDNIVGDGMTDQSIFDQVIQYGELIGVDIAPHDLRRTFAKLAHKGKAALEQIQIALGHSSIQTTERYLGIEQDLVDSPCDHLGIRAL